MDNDSGNAPDKKEMVKMWIKQLHQGADPADIQEKFNATFPDATSPDIAAAEEELVKEGMPLEEVTKLCEVHLAAFKKTVDESKPLAPEGHPIHTLLSEHESMLKMAEDLLKAARAVKSVSGDAEVLKKDIINLVGKFREAEKHYLREENVLFPYLDKHGISQPPKVMWMEHDNIRLIKKNMFSLIDGIDDWDNEELGKNLEPIAIGLSEALASHFYKENNILFAAAMNALTEEEWTATNKEFADIGYCSFSPVTERETSEPVVADATGDAVIGSVELPSGILNREQLLGIMNTLPVDVTFVDHEDKVRYFNQTKDQIFPRTVAALGTHVHNCHPQKSLHKVVKILEDFRSGKEDTAEFWIHMMGKYVYIRYFAVRDEGGKYLGCMEITHDITGIQKIEGEKRLLSYD